MESIFYKSTNWDFWHDGKINDHIIVLIVNDMCK